jgi:23S rRNA (uracil1939-C5)-methyltransferase
VVLITSPTDRCMEDFVALVQACWPAQSIYHGVTRRRSDVAIAEELRLLHGAPWITEMLHLGTDGTGRRLRFRISPFSFFQTNPLAAELLYARLRTWLHGAQPRNLYDLYGGVGSIALSCADLVEKIVSVEEVAAASADGEVNAHENGVANVQFLTAKTEQYLRSLRDGAGLLPDAAVVVDPPRAGMHPKALKYLMELAPPRIAYIACNPKLLARDCETITRQYRLDALEAFDFFPHTPHVEAVAFFEAR